MKINFFKSGDFYEDKDRLRVFFDGSKEVNGEAGFGVFLEMLDSVNGDGEGGRVYSDSQAVLQALNSSTPRQCGSVQLRSWTWASSSRPT